MGGTPGRCIVAWTFGLFQLCGAFLSSVAGCVLSLLHTAMPAAPALLRVDDDSLDIVYSFLEPQDVLLRCSLACRRLRSVERCTHGHYAAWCEWIVAAAVLARRAPDVVLPAAVQQRKPRDMFVHVARDMRLIGAATSLRRMGPSVQRFIEELRNELPSMHAAALPGLEADSIDHWWQQRGTDAPACPPAVRAFFTLLGGQSNETGSRFLGLFGTALAYNLATARVVPAPMELPPNIACSPYIVPLMFSPATQGRPHAIGPLLCDAGGLPAGTIVGVTLSDINQGHDEVNAVVVAPSLEDLVCEWCDGVVDGTFAIVPQHEHLGPHLSMFPERGGGCSSATTRGITVRMSPLLLVCASDMRLNVAAYAYQLKMAMGRARDVDLPQASGAPSATLTTRSWECYDGDGAPQRVHGEGVIGMFPVLRPVDDARRPNPRRPSSEWTRTSDAPEVADQGWFTYCSMTQIRNGKGSMGGSLQFEDCNGDEFDVEVAPCSFAPRFVVLRGLPRP